MKLPIDTVSAKDLSAIVQMHTNGEITRHTARLLTDIWILKGIHEINKSKESK